LLGVEIALVIDRGVTLSFHHLHELEEVLGRKGIKRTTLEGVPANCVEFDFDAIFLSEERMGGGLGDRVG
jgi:hypothetical protein